MMLQILDETSQELSDRMPKPSESLGMSYLKPRGQRFFQLFAIHFPDPIESAGPSNACL